MPVTSSTIRRVRPGTAIILGVLLLAIAISGAIKLWAILG